MGECVGQERTDYGWLRFQQKHWAQLGICDGQTVMCVEAERVREAFRAVTLEGVDWGRGWGVSGYTV